MSNKKKKKKKPRSGLFSHCFQTHQLAPRFIVAAAPVSVLVMREG
jgi:hypothetical protein